jgi:hypothetical protein
LRITHGKIPEIFWTHHGPWTSNNGPIKISTISDWPILKTKKQIQAFLRFANFYQRFIKHFSKIAKPLTLLTGNDTTTDQQNSFDTLAALTSQPVLTLPQAKGQFRLEADSSNYAVGAVLSQKQDDKWHPITYFSKLLSETQQNYEIYNKEMLAIYACIEGMETLPHWSR